MVKIVTSPARNRWEMAGPEAERTGRTGALRREGELAGRWPILTMLVDRRDGGRVKEKQKRASCKGGAVRSVIQGAIDST